MMMRPRWAMMLTFVPAVTPAVFATTFVRRTARPLPHLLTVASTTCLFTMEPVRMERQSIGVNVVDTELNPRATIRTTSRPSFLIRCNALLAQHAKHDRQREAA